jgi:hypothetical protein
VSGTTLKLPAEHGYYWTYRGDEPHMVVEAFPYPKWPRAHVKFCGEASPFYKQDLIDLGITRFGEKLAP